MIVDSLQYNGLCSCGREHSMETEFCVIESGSLRRASEYLAKYGINGYTVAVYDENTYKATADRHIAVDEEIILDPTDLHANEHGVDYLMENMPDGVDVLIAVGSGTIHDITRYCAYKMGIDFISCPTAASVDGFCSSVAAMTWHGCKKTLTAVAPKLVIADIDIIKNAPMRLTRSGFGDMIGKYIALADWRMANILTGEFYCDRIADMTMNATKAILDSVDGIINGEDEAYEKLTYGLILSGLAMQMLGFSRPASGAEHHVSHCIEMAPEGLGVRSDALHGEKVGVGTLLVLKEYKRLAKLEAPAFEDYKSYDDDVILSIFGEEMSKGIFDENKNDCAKGISAEMLSAHWSELCDEIAALPDFEMLDEVYKKFYVVRTFSDIGLSEEAAPDVLKYSHLVRNRLTLMRLRKCIA